MLIRDVNDSLRDADQLSRLLHRPAGQGQPDPDQPRPGPRRRHGAARRRARSRPSRSACASAAGSPPSAAAAATTSAPPAASSAPSAARRGGSGGRPPPDEPQISSRALPFPAVAPELLLIAAGAAGQDEHLTHAGPLELEAGGLGEIEVGLSRGSRRGDLRARSPPRPARPRPPPPRSSRPDGGTDPGGPLFRPPFIFPASRR